MEEKNLKKLTILHSNDMHGDFVSDQVDGKLVGGVSLLSGYLNKARVEDPDTLYIIAGDMFRGSLIDSEYKGISTIEIMNYLAPDVVTLGNHEVDYGMAHLLFLEKCCKFPIVNANLYIKTLGTRIFKSHTILKVKGMNILFIGIITEKIMAAAKRDNLMGTFVNTREAAEEVGKICDNYKTVDVDLTVLITHIGFEEDKELAKMLLPEWGVDIIIGGHSHTRPDKPECINNVLIVQAGTGTDQIGRFDISVNTDTNSVEDYEWELIPICDETCEKDEELEKIILNYKEETDRKNNAIITHFPKQLTHPKRNRETELGNLFADRYRDALGVDLMLLASGSIRSTMLGPVVRIGDLKVVFPYDDCIWGFVCTGTQLKKIMAHLMRDDMFIGKTEFFQVSSGFKIIYDYATHSFIEISLNGEPIQDEKLYRLGIQAYHFLSSEKFINLSEEEMAKNEKPAILVSSSFSVIEEYLSTHQNNLRAVEGRIEVINGPNNYPNDI